MRWSLPLWALCVVAACSLAACGGDDSDDGSEKSEPVITSIGGTAPSPADVARDLREQGLQVRDVSTGSVGGAVAQLTGELEVATRYGPLTLYRWDSADSARQAVGQLPGDTRMRYGFWVVTAQSDLSPAELESLRLKPILDPVPPEQAHISTAPPPGK